MLTWRGRDNGRSAKLSIITVVRNDPESLERTLESVFSQSVTDYELIVIDGESSDWTQDVIRKNEDRISFWVSERDSGIYDAMNKGLKYARGSYIEFLNAGDVYVDTGSLECILSHAEAGYDVIYGEINLFDQHGTFICKVPAQDFTIENVKKYGTGTVNHQAFFVKRNVAPYFSLRFQLKAELNWYIDILTQNRCLVFKHVPRAIINYRQGGKGYVKFWRNLYEWIWLVQSRFGLSQNIRNRKSYWNFVKYRYPVLKKLGL